MFVPPPQLGMMRDVRHRSSGPVGVVDLDWPKLSFSFAGKNRHAATMSRKDPSNTQRRNYGKVGASTGIRGQYEELGADG